MYDGTQDGLTSATNIQVICIGGAITLEYATARAEHGSRLSYKYVMKSR
jgi:hypothetical protein